MSHTNSTPNYNLPQFVGTDKPTWLNDVNGAFAGIDTQMKANADSATQANTNATTAVNNTGTLANLNTTDKTSLVNAVNEINTNLGVVSGVASEASTKATNAGNKIDDLEGKLNLTVFHTFADNEVTGSGYYDLGATGLSYATNADGSVGKIYGELWTKCNNPNGFTINLPTGFRPTSRITINGVCFGDRASGGTYQTINASTSLTIDTDGTVTFSKSGSWYNQQAHFIFTASLLFFKDFGDTPTPEQNN